MKNEKIYTLRDFNFDLPDKLIAQFPEKKRDESRLFVLDRKQKSFEDRKFHQLTDLLEPGDLLVFNDAKVIPARLMFRRTTGGVVEIILARRLDGRKWLIICNRTKRIKPGETLISIADTTVMVTVLSRKNEYLEIESNVEFHETLLKRIGKVPLPPYIKRDFTELDEERYQTVYARESGAVAAPTAGLHFSMELLGKIKETGVQTTYVTLHVSWGTFQPVRNEDLSIHRMHSERYIFPEESAESVNRARREGRRVIAVGTTALRVLESTFKDGLNCSGEGETRLFIYPPREVESIDALITNFHTPCSTLLMLAASFAGYDLIMDAYRTAVEKEYRFFSYGDAMMIV